MQMLTEREVAVLLRCSVAGLRRMRREQRGPRWTRVGSRLVRYPQEWLRDYLYDNAAEQQDVEALCARKKITPPIPSKETPVNPAAGSAPEDIAGASIETAEAQKRASTGCAAGGNDNGGNERAAACRGVSARGVLPRSKGGA